MPLCLEAHREFPVRCIPGFTAENAGSVDESKESCIRQRPCRNAAKTIFNTNLALSIV